jgi:hypothetical protein
MGRPEGKRPLRRTGPSESIILKLIFKNWMRQPELDQAQDTDICGALVNVTMNIWFA